jgi:hypothetical protein
MRAGIIMTLKRRTWGIGVIKAFDIGLELVLIEAGKRLTCLA